MVLLNTISPAHATTQVSLTPTLGIGSSYPQGLILFIETINVDSPWKVHECQGQWTVAMDGGGLSPPMPNFPTRQLLG